jgi:Protein of unknown function (DUF2568)
VGANLLLRFLLELSAIAIAAYWGWNTASGAWRWVLAVAAASAIVAVWWLFVAPKAAIALRRPFRFAIELGVWTAAAAGLWATGHEGLAVAFFLVAVASGTLNYAWD